jgi:uncharacterized protein
MGCCNSKEDQHGILFDIPTKNSSKYQFEIYSVIQNNQLDDLKKMIQKVFEVNFKMPTFLGRTALHIAAEHGNIKIVKYLIDADASINILDDIGCPPIFLAMQAGHLEVVEELLDLPTNDANILNKYYLSIYDYINPKKYDESIRLLHKHNIDFSSKRYR